MLEDTTLADMTDRMVQVAGGAFRMGSDADYPEERPAHNVAVDGFWIDRHAVTNVDFSTFVAAAGYVTFAERPADSALYPGATPKLLTPGIRRPSIPRPVASASGLCFALRKWQTNAGD